MSLVTSSQIYYNIIVRSVLYFERFLYFFTSRACVFVQTPCIKTPRSVNHDLTSHLSRLMEQRGRRLSLGNARRTITRRKTSGTAIYFKKQFLASARASTRSSSERLHALKSVETRRAAAHNYRKRHSADEKSRFVFSFLSFFFFVLLASFY